MRREPTEGLVRNLNRGASSENSSVGCSQSSAKPALGGLTLNRSPGAGGLISIDGPSTFQHARNDVPALSDSGEAFLTAVGFEEQVIRVYPKSL